MDASVGDLLRLRDQVGVLSVYVGIDPAAEANNRPPWRIKLNNELREIARRLHAEGDHGRRMAFEHRLKALAPALDELVDAAESGRGRALFAGVASGEVYGFAVQVALPGDAVLGDVAHIVPLLRADDGRPRALILVGRDAVRVLEARLGRADQLQAFDVEPVVYDGPERKGPTASNPLRAQKTVTQRERWERHVEADHLRRLARTATRLGPLAAARRWEVAVVAGDPRAAEILVKVLRAAGVETEFVERDLVELSPARALEDLAPVIDSIMARRNLALVRRARDAAAAGGRGAAGLEPVLEALEQGLVAELLLGADRPLPGAIAPDGHLLAARGGLPTDPQFADRLVLRAFRTDAPTTVVGGEAAAALDDVDGVAGLLRARSAVGRGTSLW